MGGSKETTTNTTSTTNRDLKASSQSNPFYQTKTDMFGNTTSNFVDGTAGKTVYDFTNKNISTLLNNYLNPTLDSVTNQAKLRAFNKTQQQNLQNNIINPLANSNMIRSSQATNMYNNLSNQSSDYANQLLAEDQTNTANMINTLMSMYMNAYNGINSEQSNSMNASFGSGNTETTTNTKAS